jgi:hypothetical protein
MSSRRGMVTGWRGRGMKGVDGSVVYVYGLVMVLWACFVRI